jgi:hypothetical protein
VTKEQRKFHNESFSPTRSAVWVTEYKTTWAGDVALAPEIQNMHRLLGE